MVKLQAPNQLRKEMTTMSVRLPMSQYNELKAEADKAGIKVSEAIRQLIDQLTKGESI